LRPDSIVSVLVPAASHDLLDLATVRDELGITAGDTKSDAWIVRAIAQVSRMVMSYCKRVFAVETISEMIFLDQDPYPYQVPGGVSRLQLTRRPLVEATLAAFNPISPLLFDLGEQSGISVTQTIAQGVTQSLVAGTDFIADPDTGTLLRLDPFTGVAMRWEAFPTTVVYEAGYSAIPDDLVEAALRLITARFRDRGRDPFLKERDQPGLGHQVFWVGSLPGVRGAFPEDIRAVLDQYRVPTIA
jgi:hypothetical protein